MALRSKGKYNDSGHWVTINGNHVLIEESREDQVSKLMGVSYKDNALYENTRKQVAKAMGIAYKRKVSFKNVAIQTGDSLKIKEIKNNINDIVLKIEVTQAMGAPKQSLDKLKQEYDSNYDSLLKLLKSKNGGKLIKANPQTGDESESEPYYNGQTNKAKKDSIETVKTEIDVINKRIAKIQAEFNRVAVTGEFKPSKVKMYIEKMTLQKKLIECTAVLEKLEGKGSVEMPSALINDINNQGKLVGKRADEKGKSNEKDIEIFSYNGAIAFTSIARSCDDGVITKSQESNSSKYHQDTLSYYDNLKLNPYDVPYVVLPYEKGNQTFLDMGVKIGDVVAVVHKDKVVFGLYIDNGPPERVGEVSMKIQKELLNNTNPKVNPMTYDVNYVIFPNTRDSHAFGPQSSAKKEDITYESIQEVGNNLWNEYFTNTK